MAKNDFLGPVSGAVLTETPDGLLKTAPGGGTYSNGPYEQENYPSYGMPGMNGEGYHLNGPSDDPMAPYRATPCCEINHIKNGK